MKKALQNVIDYIEENLKTEITADELAQMAGYSVFHFYRLFLAATGMPVMQYILHRRLLHAIFEMQGRKNRTDIILSYGFDTYAGFYRAFRRSFCCTPSEYIKKNRVKRPVKINLFQEAAMQISHKKASSMLKKWGLENEAIQDIFYDNGNRNDHAYYVGNEYVLKFTRNLGCVNAHVALTNALADAGLNAATAVKNNEGANYVQDGDVYFYLTRRIQGKQLNAMDAYDRMTAGYIGEIIGQMHKALVDMDAIVSEENFVDTVTGWAVKSEAVKARIDPEFLREYTDKLASFRNCLPVQCIHRDPNPGNIILSDDGWGVIDFDLSQKNIRIYDPVYASTAVLSETFNTDKRDAWFFVYQEILCGYDRTAKMTKDEKEAAPLVVLGNQFICLAFFAGDEKYRDIFETNLDMTRWLIKNFDKLKIQ